jgi:hypothetical protein
MGELSMHQQQPKAQTAQKDPQQIALALKEGGKSAQEIMDVLQLIFTLNMRQAMKILQQMEYSATDIFATIKNGFQLEDKQIIAQMLELNFSHEEALQAMLDQI